MDSQFQSEGGFDMDCLFQSESGFDVDFSRRVFLTLIFCFSQSGFDVDFSRRVFLTLIFCFSQKINRYVMDGARREETGGWGVFINKTCLLHMVEEGHERDCH